MTNAIFWIRDPETYQLLYVSSFVEDLFGFDARYFYNDIDFWFSRLHPDDKNVELLQMKELFTSGSSSLEYHIISGNGSERKICDQAWLLYDKQGEIGLICGIATETSLSTGHFSRFNSVTNAMSILSFLSKS